MKNNNNKLNIRIIVTILIFLLIQVFSVDIYEQYFSRANENIICTNKVSGCSFKVSSNYPISPKIPTSMPTDAILGNYRYIYLFFSIPTIQTQKSFYLEAYDISDGETIISNGDCYLIDTTQNKDYEIRIYKTLKVDSYIRFGFFGISKDFTMTVKLTFQLSISLYYSDIALTYDNSLNKQPGLFGQDYELKLIEQKERQILVKQTIYRIVEEIFGTTIDINNLFIDDYFCSETFSFPPFTVTISYAVGLELSTEKFFQPKGLVLSEVFVAKSKISKNISFLGGRILISNYILKLLEMKLQNKINTMALQFGLDTDYYSVTVSIDISLALTYTLTFYYDDTKTIYYEIEIKIEIDNNSLNGLVMSQALSFVNVNDYDYSYPNINEPKGGILYAAFAFILILIVSGGETLLSLGV